MSKISVVLATVYLLVACSNSNLATSVGLINPLPTGLTASVSPVPSGSNILPIQITDQGYLNEPVVSVTICNPGSTSSCVTVDRLLLDTGSSGLRVFKSLISSLTLPQVSDPSGNGLANCVAYADGTTQWGPVKTADLVLGGETVSGVHIQVIDATYANVPASCSGAENSPTAAGYNGILGVGVRDQDCGTACVGSAVANVYFGCTNSGTCNSTATGTLSAQVRNPVAAMTTASNSEGINDNNGTVFVMPTVPLTGAASASGYLVFGIGTRANNTPSASVKVFPTDTHGYFTTNYAGVNLTSFIDSGSNGLFFPSSVSIPTCSGWFCPSSLLSLNATMKSYPSGAVTNSVSFQIINAEQVFVSNNYAYSDLGAAQTGTFDWGLPFFFGRSVYTAISGKSAIINGTTYSSANGNSPFYAY